MHRETLRLLGRPERAPTDPARGAHAAEDLTTLPAVVPPPRQVELCLAPLAVCPVVVVHPAGAVATGVDCRGADELTKVRGGDPQALPAPGIRHRR